MISLKESSPIFQALLWLFKMEVVRLFCPSSLCPVAVLLSVARFLFAIVGQLTWNLLGRKVCAFIMTLEAEWTAASFPAGACAGNAQSCTTPPHTHTQRIIPLEMVKCNFKKNVELNGLFIPNSEIVACLITCWKKNAILHKVVWKVSERG